MTRTCHPRANLIAQAEDLASGLVTLTERERAAYRAAFLADPYSRCTYERAHRRAAAARDDAFEALIELCDELCREGLVAFAVNLQRNAVARCAVAIDIAAFELAGSFSFTHPGKGTHETGTIPPAAPRRPEEEDGLSRLQAPHRGGEAGQTLDLHLPSTPSREGGIECA